MANIAESIKLILVKRKMSVKELSSLTNISPNSLYTKLKIDDGGKSFKMSEIEAIAKALDCTFDTSFILNDTKEQF